MVDKELIRKALTDSINKCYTSYHYTNSRGEALTLKVREVKRPSTFLKHLHNARTTIPSTDRWRVLEPTREYAKHKYENCKLYVTEHGSTIGIDNEGTIISVCSYKDSNGHSLDNARALMEYAISQGGNKLDTFDGNYGFYTYCGFSPVSWIHFQDFDTTNIPEWVTGHNNNPTLFNEEDIVFFKYTGDKTSFLSPQEFYESTDAVTGTDAYEQASKIRDNYG